MPPANWLKSLALLLLLLVSSRSIAFQWPEFVSEQSSTGAFTLVGAEHLANIYVDAADDSAVQRAAADLRDDIQRVSGQRPQIVRSAQALGSQGVIMGTLGQSQLLDELVAQGKVDPAAIRDEWDAYHLEVVDNPLPGVERALVIAGSNRRGAVYGAYELSENIGVSPWYWWADIPVAPKKQLYIKADTRIQDAPQVKYRGIFLNNEAPALTNWVRQDGNYDHTFYEKVFELILRLKGNFLWPAMWDAAFNDDDALNPQKAHEYGIVMSTSHHEPMMRAHEEWAKYGKGAWDYSTNKTVLDEFWKGGIERNKPYESVITLGMRGDGDEPMTEGENIELLEDIVANQRRLIGEVFAQPAEEIPQVWTLYKEVQYYYEGGMRVPDDVILLWANDNFGNIRRLPMPEERKRSGGAGVYYHFDYVGGPRSYRWINTVPLAKIWEQMHQAYSYEANKIWIVNVGDLKPMEYPIDFFLRMAWSPKYWTLENMAGFGERWASRNFGVEHAAEIAQLMDDYTRHNGRRKPEAQSAQTYSILHYAEAERIYAEMQDMIERAEALYQKIPSAQRDAYEQLVRHPVKASANITQMYINQARNHLYAKQGRVYANGYAEKVRTHFDEDAKLERRFHTEVSDGKWNHMMSQTRIGYTHWKQPVKNTLPLLLDYEPHAGADMGVAIEGEERAWPVPGGALVLPQFTLHGVTEREITVYNRGTAPFQYAAKATQDWIKLSATEGVVEQDQRITVSIDWARAPVGQWQEAVLITGTGWGSAQVVVKGDKPDPRLARQAKGYVEADGYISIEAGNFNRQQVRKGYTWQVIPGHGRTLSSISVYPLSDESTTDLNEASYVEYDVFFFNSGEFKVHAYFAPSLNISPDRGLRYGVGFAGGDVQVVDVLADLSEQAWEQSVLDNVRVAVSMHTIEQPGSHRLRIYRVDPAATLQKIVIDTGDLKPSYLGPVQSPTLGQSTKR